MTNQMKLRPRNKRINYRETPKKYRSPPVPFSRDRTTERNLRPKKLTSYQDASDGECSSDLSQQNKKRKLLTKNLRIPLSILSNYDANDDEDEYRSMRRENTAQRFNILKNMGLINRARKVGCKGSKVTPKRAHSDMIEEDSDDDSDVMKANEEKSELASTPDSESDSEEDYTTQRKRKIAERCNTLKTMAKQEEMGQKVNMSMVTSTPIILLNRIPE